MGKGISLEELNAQNKSIKNEIIPPRYKITPKSKKPAKINPGVQFSEDFPNPKENYSLPEIVVLVCCGLITTVFLFMMYPVIIEVVNFIISAIGFVIDFISGLFRIIFDVVGFVFDIIRGIFTIIGKVIDFLDPLLKFLYEVAEVLFWCVVIVVGFPFILVYYILMAIAGY